MNHRCLGGYSTLKSSKLNGSPSIVEKGSLVFLDFAFKVIFRTPTVL